MRLFLEVPKRHPQCVHGQEPFSAGSTCHSILKFQNNEWKRIDLCDNCWKGLANTSIVSEAASTWITQIPAAASKELSDNNHALESFPLLTQSLEKNSQKGDAEAFLIATYLVRKKLLKYINQIDKDGVKYMLYEVVETGEIIGIKKVSLSLFENPKVLEEIKSELAAQNQQRQNKI